jgi:hypothetical protein
VRNLSAFIKYLAKQEAMERTAAGIPTAESAACSLAPFRAASRGLSRSLSTLVAATLFFFFGFGQFEVFSLSVSEFQLR